MGISFPNGFSSGIIEDGYTIKGWVPEAPGIHPGVTVWFRQAGLADRMAVRAASTHDTTGKVIAKKTVEVIARHLKQWDMLAHDGNPVPINEETVGACCPSIIERLLDMILGYSPGEEVVDEKN